MGGRRCPYSLESLILTASPFQSLHWFCPLGRYRWNSAEILPSIAWTICWSQMQRESCLLPFRAAAPCAVGAFCSFEPGDVLVYTEAGYEAISSNSDWHWQLFQRVCVKRVKLPLCWTNQSLPFFQKTLNVVGAANCLLSMPGNDSEFIKPKRLLEKKILAKLEFKKLGFFWQFIEYIKKYGRNRIATSLTAL